MGKFITQLKIDICRAWDTDSDGVCLTLVQSTAFEIFAIQISIFDTAMAPRSDDVLEMSESSECELTVLSSIVFRVKDETSCCVFDCSASTSTSGLMFHRFLKVEGVPEA